VPLLAGCGAQGSAENAAEEPPEVPINVRTLAIERRTLDEYLTVTGVLRPLRGTDVSTEESGVVASVPREKGQNVSRGTPLIRLERHLLEAEMRAAEANRSLLEYDESRTRRLFEEKQVSRYEMLTLETRLEAARAEADIARRRWERAEVKAPYEGIVADRYVEPGQLVRPGSPVARVVDPYTLKLSASVSEREVAWIREGAPAMVTLDGLDRVVPGRVAWISFEAEPSSGKFQVEVHVDNPDLALRPGVVGRAQILKRRHEDVVVIPHDAVVPQPVGLAGFVVEGDRSRLRPLELGADQGMLTIVSRGLEKGDQLIVRGQRDVLDGSLVRVTERATAPDGSTPEDPPSVRAEYSFSPLELVEETETPPAAAAERDAGS
jgi:membrane fusion protein (multidrug efflux system)